MSKGYLLDTSVLSLLVPGQPAFNEHLFAWFNRNGHRLYISTITITEIELGICKLRRNGGEMRARLLSQWLKQLTETGTERILPFDIAAGLLAGNISDQALAAGRHPGFADVAIAAIAGVNELVVLTLNGRHFDPLGIDHLDPLASPLS